MKSLKVAPPIKPQVNGTVLAWENPPPRSKNGIRAWYEDVLPELKQQPGRWARVLIRPNIASATARKNAFDASVRRGHSPKGYEMCARWLPDGRAAVYARYTGA